MQEKWQILVTFMLNFDSTLKGRKQSVETPTTTLNHPHYMGRRRTSFHKKSLAQVNLARPFGEILFSLAESEGFEPPVRRNAYTAFRVRLFRPLRQLSCQLIANHIPRYTCKNSPRLQAQR